MKVDNSKLSPCPFCGGSPELHHDKLVQSGNAAILIKCKNKDCLIQPRSCFNSSFLTHADMEVHAVTAWNKRG